VTVLRSILLFVVAALAEIGGAWLIWEGVRERKGLIWIGAGIIVLGLYGFVATLQPDAAARAQAWVAPFRASFSDLKMEVVELVAEGDTVAARFTCSGTHTGVWLGHPPTHRRFHRVPEVYFFGFTDDRISRAWGLEDTHRRLRQLGFD
jgi:hypothetical protein